MTDKAAVQTAPKSIDLLAAEVVAELKKAGLTVREQIGIGAHRIDIGIVNEDETGYDLGIEIDSKLYGGSINTRERDIHRGAYLESRGWKIYRLWSTSWWHNKEQEIKKILAMLPPKKPKEEIVEESVGVDF
jgi:very-short-patch-repair endonuclease